MSANTRALLAVSLGVFCIELDSFALNLALPRIGATFHTHEGLQWTISAYLLSVGALMLGAGYLADRFGPRLLLVIGLSLFGSTALLCALAPTLPMLIAARALQGAGGALIMPAGLALLTTVFPAATRGRATGLALSAGGIAMACGPFVGGAVTAWLGWRAVFWLNIPIIVVASALAGRAPESRNTHPSTPDSAGLILLTAALAALAGMVQHAPMWGWTHPASIALLTLGLLALLALVGRERTVANPLLDPALFRNAPYLARTAAGSVANAATVVFLFVVPLTLHGPWELSPSAAGLAFLVPSVMLAVAAPLAGRVRPTWATGVLHGSLASAGLFLCAAALADTLPEYLLAIGGCGLTLGVAKALTLTATQAVVPPHRAGAASGVTKTAVTITGGFGVALAGGAVSQPILPQDASNVLVTTGVLALGAAGALTAGTVLGRGVRRAGTGTPGPGTRG